MSRRGEQLRLGYRPALDGMRGVAVILVVLSHAALVSAGVIGVNVFFVLSGFLITSLILIEQSESGRLDFFAFYRRRAARLLPALFAVSVAVSAYLLLDGQTSRIAPDVGGALSYVGNWLQAIGMKMGLTSHTWSLAVEEQFYVVWPLLMVFVTRFRRPGLIVATLLIASVAWRVLMPEVSGATGPRVTRGTDMVAPALIAGALLAFVIRDHPRIDTGRIGWLVGAGMVALAVALLATRTTTSWWFELSALGSVALISSVHLASGGLLTFAPLVYIGRISYGIYLWHFPIFVVLDAPVVVEMAVVLAVSMASFHLLEAPILRRFGRRGADTTPVAQADRGIPSLAPRYGRTELVTAPQRTDGPGLS